MSEMMFSTFHILYDLNYDNVKVSIFSGMQCISVLCLLPGAKISQNVFKNIKKKIMFYKKNYKKIVDLQLVTLKIGKLLI